MAEAQPFTHYVFVDFENVPRVDLGVIGGQSVHVTLMVGKQQKHLEVGLVREALRHADQVELIEVGVAGRNALDLVLAAHLGRASLRHPDAEFTVVSRDRDFDPLLAHLQANGVRVRRNPEFFTQARRHEPRAEREKEPVQTSRPRRPRRRAESDGSPSTTAATPHPHRLDVRPERNRGDSAPAGHHRQSPQAPDKLEKIAARLTSGTSPLPRTQARLMHDLAAYFGNKLSEPELGQVFEELVRRDLVRIGENAKLTYPKRR